MRLTRFRLISIGLLTLIGGGAFVVVMLRHEPDFYRRAEVPASSERGKMSNDFVMKEFTQCIAAFKHGQGGWQSTFSQDNLNAFFEEDFVRFGDADHFRKIGITNPRVEFTDGQIRFGFRFGSENWATVLSYDLKVWLVPNEPNVLAIEVVRRRAGALPIPTQQIFKEIQDLGRRHDIDVEWYRLNGNPVAIVKLQHDRSRPTAQLRQLKITEGKLDLFGVNYDPAQNQIEETIKSAPAAAKEANAAGR